MKGAAAAEARCCRAEDDSDGAGAGAPGEPLLGLLDGGELGDARALFLLERGRVRELCAWLALLALCDAAWAQAALGSPRGASWASDAGDVGVLSAARGAALALLAVATASLRTPVLSQHATSVAYWAVFLSLSFGGAKLIAFEWHSAAAPRWVLIGWVVSGAAELVVLGAQATWLAEQLRWVRALDGHSRDAFELVKEDVLAPERAGEDIESAGGGRARTAAEAQAMSKLWTRTALDVIRPYVWPGGWSNRVRSVASFAFVALRMVGELLQPLVFGRAVQALSEPSTPLNTVGELVALNAVLKVGTDLCARLQELVFSVVCRNAEVEISSHTYAHIHAMSADWHIKKKMGSVVRKLDRGVSAAESLVQQVCIFLVPGALESIAALVIMRLHFRVSSIAGVAFFGASVFLALNLRMAIYRKKVHAAVNAQDNHFHDMVADALINFETVKLFATEPYEVSRYTKALRTWRQHTMTRTSLWAAQASLQNIIVCSSTAVMLLIAARGVRAEPPVLSLGDFVSIAAYVASVFKPIQNVGRFMATFLSTSVDMHNLVELLAERSEVRDAPGALPLSVPNKSSNSSNSSSPGGARPLKQAAQLAIEFDCVDFNYPTQAPEQGLKGVSLAVPRGTTTAVVGTTGAGKSTLAHLLVRFYDPQAGTVRVFGQDVRAVQQRSLRRAIGIVSQDVVLFNDTILHNLTYGCPGASEQQVERACEQAQLLEVIRALPHGLATKVGERGLKLSGGEKQRIAIARCLLKNPPIVGFADGGSFARGRRAGGVVSIAITSLAPLSRPRANHWTCYRLCWTRPRARSTRRQNAPCRPPSRRSRSSAPCSSSRTA
jgi:ABC-type transport system involved in Fe-S cluster assembly fused permease/ATPase subunit